jgi:hypothetical protein
MTPRKSHIPTLRNAYGGWYQSGKLFTMQKRLEIGYDYLDMCVDQWPERPSQQQLVTKAKISQSTAGKIIMEFENTGSLTDPELRNLEKAREREKQYYLDPTEELFLLALRSEKPARQIVNMWHTSPPTTELSYP